MHRAKILIVLATGLIAVATIFHSGWLAPLRNRLGAGATVDDRLRQYSAASRGRLAIVFRRSAIAYPPAQVVLVVFKQEKVLEIYAAGITSSLQRVARYPILAASGGPGPKLREGDRQVPEGIYRIESLNPNSRFHLSLRLNYPNDFDRRVAAMDQRSAADLG